MSRARLLSVAILVGASWLTPTPASAAPDTTPRFDVTAITGTGCAAIATSFEMESKNFAGTKHVIRTTVRADGLTFMDEGVELDSDDAWSWSLYASTSYGPVADQGTWPLPPDTPVYVQFNVEQPKGTVLSTQRVVFDSCNTAGVLYLGRDKCPTIDIDTLHGCPVFARTLTMGYHKSQRELAGALFSDLRPAFHKARTIFIWKVRPGADRKVASTRTTAQGSFVVRSPGKGRYYATSKAYVIPTTGEAMANSSTIVKIG